MAEVGEIGKYVKLPDTSSACGEIIEEAPTPTSMWDDAPIARPPAEEEMLADTADGEHTPGQRIARILQRTRNISFRD